MINKELEEFIKDETKVFEERLRAKAEELQEQMIEKPKTIWDLKIEDGEEYYCIPIYGVIYEAIFNSVYDEYARDIGNAFLTREEAEFELERRKIEVIMKKYSRPFKYGEKNYYLQYDYDYDNDWDRILIGVLHTLTDSIYYFESEEIARKAIDEIGEDRLIKYWFRVEE